MPEFRVRPMQHRAVFRWTFAASGLWLMLSPFLLFAGEAAKSDLFVGEAGLRHCHVWTAPFMQGLI